MYRIQLTRATRAELREIVRWIAEDSPNAAAIWLSGLLDKLASLRTMPRRCPLAPENDYFSGEVRHLIYGRRWRAYRILFTVTEPDVVTIMHIRHGSMDVLRPDE